MIKVVFRHPPCLEGRGSFFAGFLPLQLGFAWGGGLHCVDYYSIINCNLPREGYEGIHKERNYSI